MWKKDCKRKTGKDVERRGDDLFYNTILLFHRMNVGTTEQSMGLVKFATELLST
jgi:hypothetical protein